LILVGIAVRIFAFLRKEVVEILRQPRLVLTLVVAPFLILLLFGLGYRQTAPPVRTLFVMGEDNPLRSQTEEYTKVLGPELITVQGVTADEEAARAQLREHRTDLVVLVPDDPYAAVEADRQATFNFLHNQIDPLQADTIGYFSQVFTNAVNRTALEETAREGQQNAAEAQQDVRAAKLSAAALRQSLQAGDQGQADSDHEELDRSVSAIELALGAAAAFVPGSSGGDEGGLSSIRRQTDALGNQSPPPSGPESTGTAGAPQTGPDSDLARVEQLERDLDTFDQQLARFREMEPAVLVQPYRAEVSNVARVEPSPAHYYGPGVVVLLLQHLTLTFAALSLVRERRQGALELFRVSPLTAAETLLGKYLSYMVVGAVLGGVLTLLLVYVLGVPMVGSWAAVALSLGGLLLVSLGVGSIISLLARTETQAVQYSMIVLLTSVFFSGFLLSLNLLAQPVRLVSWLVPATYAIKLLQDVMLRGTLSEPLLVVVLYAGGLVLFLISWRMLRGQMARL